MPCNMQDLSSPTKDQAVPPAQEVQNLKPLDHQGNILVSLLECNKV